MPGPVYIWDHQEYLDKLAQEAEFIPSPYYVTPDQTVQGHQRSYWLVNPQLSRCPFCNSDDLQCHLTQNSIYSNSGDYRGHRYYEYFCLGCRWQQRIPIHERITVPDFGDSSSAQPSTSPSQPSISSELWGPRTLGN